jgi:hypothetical protein
MILSVSPVDVIVNAASPANISIQSSGPDGIQLMNSMSCEPTRANFIVHVQRDPVESLFCSQQQ